MGKYIDLHEARIIIYLEFVLCLFLLLFILKNPFDYDISIIPSIYSF